MALSYFGVFVAISLLMAAKGDNHVPPSLAPFFDDLCKEVECGKGSCEAAPGSPFNFKCNCEQGWKRTRLDDEDDLEFLPCIIPNCTYTLPLFHVTWTTLVCLPPLRSQQSPTTYPSLILAIGSTVGKERAQRTQHVLTRVNATLATPISSTSLHFPATMIVLLGRTRVKGLASKFQVLLQMVTVTKVLHSLWGSTTGWQSCLQVLLLLSENKGSSHFILVSHIHT
ncbi:hypothetical protein SASPL_123009 [Salvia splendens]|uniref:Uncharacterized protein n=1 Tax=Salvia splendens TaxID=180675 RepID=A0A8X8XKB1_SALSN|nr:hypothetical protein SASPL_123009 [Salvia splendens]